MKHSGPWYNPKRDLQPVDQSGTIDLSIAMADGMIPSSAGVGVEEQEEDIDPDAMMPPPQDIFDRYQQSFTVKESLDKKDKKDKKDKASG